MLQGASICIHRLTLVLKTTGAVGFRLDAIKHIDRKFLLKWVSELITAPGYLVTPGQIQETRLASGRKDMFAVCAS